MNKKGFTLIELIVVIALIGIIGVVVTISLTDTFKKTQERDCTEFIESIKEAGCTYASLSNIDTVSGERKPNCDRSVTSTCTYTIGQLIEQDMIDESVNKCSKNNEPLSTSSSNIRVVVKFDADGKKTCTVEGIE